MALLNEGVPGWAIDKAMLEFGMPMGPITLADTVGLDVCLSVAKNLGQYFHTPIPPRLVELVEKRKLGRKTGEGFYKYTRLANKSSQKKHPMTNHCKILLIVWFCAC